MDSETNTFAASGADVITRTIDVDIDTTADQLSQEEFQDFYEIDRTAKEIVQGDYKRIALQFPDELLHDSVPIFRALKSRVGDARDLYVLADTSYGSCCVDEVAAQHVNADAIVHYGHACLSLQARLPVIYVFGKKPLDIDHCVASFASAYDTYKTPSDAEVQADVILLTHDVSYTHLSEHLLRSIQDTFHSRQATISYHARQNISASGAQSALLTDSKPSTIFYVGPDSLSLANLITTNFGCKVFTYDPTPSQPSAVLASSAQGTLPPLLKRRYTQVLKARDASTIGILIGALPSSPLPSTDGTTTTTAKVPPKNPFLPLLTHLRRLIAKSGRKSYTIAVGKPNPAKLANFLEVECWVLVACSENSLLLAGGASSKAGGYHSSTAGWAQGTGKDYLQPIVTPFELEIALRDEVEWTGKYVLDFEQVLKEASERSEENEAEKEGEIGEVDDGRPKFSLVTGTYRPIKRYGAQSQDEKIDGHGGQDVDGDSALVLRNQEGALAKLGTSAAAHYLSTRTYQGLDPRLGVDEPSILEQGRSGIARGYQDDQEHQELEKKSAS
ncbi:diphthamide biosynthesis protein [Panaeolus papilionaceus]|nr:diphthamide biosynthesis protein [Panaeolus papilionaceus]